MLARQCTTRGGLPQQVIVSGLGKKCEGNLHEKSRMYIARCTNHHLNKCNLYCPPIKIPEACYGTYYTINQGRHRASSEHFSKNIAHYLMNDASNKAAVSLESNSSRQTAILF